MLAAIQVLSPGIGAALRGPAEFNFNVSDKGVIVLAFIAIIALCIGLYEPDKRDGENK